MPEGGLHSCPESRPIVPFCEQLNHHMRSTSPACTVTASHVCSVHALHIVQHEPHVYILQVARCGCVHMCMCMYVYVHVYCMYMCLFMCVHTV